MAALPVGNSCSRDAFKVVVKDIANQLSSEDMVKLRFFCGGSLEEGENKHRSALDLLWDMLRKGKFSHTNPEGMEKLLRDIDRCDLITMHLEGYKERYMVRDATSCHSTATAGIHVSTGKHTIVHSTV